METTYKISIKVNICVIQFRIICEGIFIIRHFYTLKLKPGEFGDIGNAT